MICKDSFNVSKRYIKNNDTYQLVRTISRGIIVKDNNFIIKFIPWNDVNQLSKDIRDKFK